MTGRSNEESFPDDLSGHFWTTLEHIGEIGRWRFTILDYQNTVLLTGLATSEGQAARLVRAWDAVITADVPDNEDPSLSDDATGD